MVPTSPYVKDFTHEIKQSLAAMLPEGAKILKFHQSLCPGCVDEEKWDTMKAFSVVYVLGNKVWMSKKCDIHGAFTEVYWSDYDLYKKAERFQDAGLKILNPDIKKTHIDCPSDCGLCAEHESHTGLGNIVLTNRCDLTCWYCFFYAKEGEPIYEPTMDQIKFMLKRMKDKKPVGANAVQLTGGEPTLREDIVEIVKAAREIGYDHVQLNTNGVNLSKSLELTKGIKEAGVHTLYMSFDGMTPETNPKNYWEAPGAIENCRKAGIGIVLVPTVIGGINDHELGDILRFGLGNIDTIRSVNFQPVSLVGRMPDKLRKKQRITIPGAIKKIEEQTDGQIGREHWFTVPCAKNITEFVEAIKSKPQYRLSIHFACGMATYVFKDGERIVPLPEFFDIEGFFEYLAQLTKEINDSPIKAVKKPVVLGKLIMNIGQFIDEEKKPKGMNFAKVMAGAVGGGNYHGLADFHQNSLFVGMMHFQDPYNWDIDRIHKCDIHYATPDGRILPFCTFNVIPALYRDKIQREFSVSSEEWEKKTGKKLADDRHHRKLTKEQMVEIKENYDKYRKHKEKIPQKTDWGHEWEQPVLNQDLVQIGRAVEFVTGAKMKPTMKHPAAGPGCGPTC
jgi:uncharacterized radical SAM superfamily Fe-S cluster-containing enzyme